MQTKDGEKLNFSWVDLGKSFLYLLGSKKKPYLILLSVLFIVQFYSIVPPLVLGKIVDFFTNYKAGQSLNIFYYYAIFLGATFALTSFTRLTIKRNLGNLLSDIAFNTRVKGFERLINLSFLDTRKETAGEKSQKIQGGVQAFRNLMHQTNNEIFESITSVIGIFTIFIFLKASYLIFMFVYITGFYLIIKYFYSRIQQLNYEFNKAIEKSSGTYVEGLSNIITIKSLGAKKSFSSHVAFKEEIRKNFEYKIRRYGVGQWITFQIFSGLCLAIFLLMVGRDVVTQAITVGSVVMFYGYIEKLRNSSSSILDIYESVIESKTALARMMPIFWQTVKTHNGTKTFPKNWKEITIKNGTFDYKRDEKNKDMVGVSNLNISIYNGEKIGIVGKSGCGKSTLAKILLGLIEFDSGNYQIDGENFYDIKEESTLKNIALVLQETEMFDLSLKENVTMMKNIKPEMYEKAIQVSQLNEVVNKLPQGQDTLIGEKGYHLSGGERQRVGIARVICKNSQIIIFDEATSSLDSNTEKLIQNALENSLTQKTVITIAHRVSTLKNVDTIYVMDDGEIIEQGKYQELLKNKNSTFSQIYDLQQKKKRP